MKKVINKILHTMRWGFVPTRYLTRLFGLKLKRLFRKPGHVFKDTEIIEKTGYKILQNLDNQSIQEIQTIYRKKSENVRRTNLKIPFVNLFTEEDISALNPVFKIAFSEKIQSCAYDYFRGKYLLDSIQVLYSFKTEDKLKESQLWHLDYGDTKSFHFICYINDVTKSEDGPFVFLDKNNSNKIGKSLFVRRVPDEEVVSKVRNDDIIHFKGSAGSCLFVDPSVCYHYGSRCLNPRLAIFITFNSWFPFAQPSPFIIRNKKIIYENALKLNTNISPLNFQKQLALT